MHCNITTEERICMEEVGEICMSMDVGGGSSSQLMALRWDEPGIMKEQR